MYCRSDTALSRTLYRGQSSATEVKSLNREIIDPVAYKEWKRVFKSHEKPHYFTANMAVRKTMYIHACSASDSCANLAIKMLAAPQKRGKNSREQCWSLKLEMETFKFQLYDAFLISKLKTRLEVLDYDKALWFSYKMCTVNVAVHASKCNHLYKVYLSKLIFDVQCENSG